jgi:hypothetical protein
MDVVPSLFWHKKLPPRFPHISNGTFTVPFLFQARSICMPKPHKSLKMNDDILLVQNGYVAVPELKPSNIGKTSEMRLQSLGTIFSNMASYGFIPSLKATQEIMLLSDAGIYEFWNNLEPALKHVTGADRNMGDFVVYKNFPKEILEMSQAQYWTNQILMYWGLPNELFTQPPKAREELKERLKLKVLNLATEDTAFKVFEKLCKVRVKWTDNQEAQISYLLDTYSQLTLDMDEFAFKENGVNVIAQSLELILAGRRKVVVSNATDVLRLSAALSDGDISLRTPTKLRNLSRPERRLLVGLIEGSKNLADDFATRPEQWKRLLSRLHPSDFKATRTVDAYDKLYRKEAKTLAARVEPALAQRDAAALGLLKQQPGRFMRQLHQAYDLFGEAAFDAFQEVTDKLAVEQLVKLDAYLKTIDTRRNLLITPKGSWTKAKLVENGKRKIDRKHLTRLRTHISSGIYQRLDALYPDGFDLGTSLDNVKLQGSSQKLAAYGRGTSFDIPENAKFLRTASFWSKKAHHDVWFDVGWNMFDHAWKPVGTICWDSTEPFPQKGAVFSGDPTNSKDLKGRATQMIDLYPERLLADGVRYAVWNVLCYSRIPFSQAEEVLATLQWGEEPQKGKLYEPGRAQMVFPLTGNEMSKFVAYIDLVERKLVYMDVSLRADVRSAKNSASTVSEFMPSFVEHLESLPSVADIFIHGKSGSIPVLANDEGRSIEGTAYVHDRRNAENNFEPMNLETILNAKGDIVSKDCDLDTARRPGI